MLMDQRHFKMTSPGLGSINIRSFYPGLGRDSDGEVFILNCELELYITYFITVYLNYTYYINILEDAYGC